MILAEKNDHLGGNLVPAGAPYFKEDLRSFLELMQRRVKASSAKVLLNTRVTPQLIAQFRPDALVVAIGAESLRPAHSRAGQPQCGHGCGRRAAPGEARKAGVIIGGGLVGAELAVSLAAEGHGCTVVEMRSAVAMDVSPFYRGGLMPQLEKAATLRTGAAVCRVEQDGVVIRTESGEEKLPADSVVCAAGFRPDYGQVDVLCAQVAESYVIGDCQRVGQIYQAMNQGYFTARRI